MPAPTFQTTRVLTRAQIRALKPGDPIVFCSSPDRYKRARVVRLEGPAPDPHSATVRDSGRRLFYVDVMLLRKE